MPLGWIDFSKTERNKVLTVLALLTEKDALDELGIAPVRDGFSNMFFPGTSTIQTRAKYFFIVPYALRDLERGGETDAQKFLKAFDDAERKCGETFHKNHPNDFGIIGRRALAGGRWVKRTPADIYWSGLKQYGIFTGGRLSLSEYAKAVCAVKGQKRNLVRLGNRRDQAEERELNEFDDRNAGDIRSIHFWNIPTYREDWQEKLVMELSTEEAVFLKQQIILNCPHSLFAHTLKQNIKEVRDIQSFPDLKAIINSYPKQIQEDYELAEKFSEFNYVLRTLYNVILSDGQCGEANETFAELRASLSKIAALDLEKIFSRTNAQRSPAMCKFLRSAKKCMQYEEIDRLKKIIRERETALKGVSRARTAHPGEYDKNAWFGGRRLSYRFGNAKTLLADIFHGEETTNVKSKSK